MTEMNKLIAMLAINDIPFEAIEQGYDFLCDEQTYPKKNPIQVWYPNKKDCVCDVICNSVSIGGTEGYLEIMGLSENEDGVEGYLTSTEIFYRIKGYHERT